MRLVSAALTAALILLCALPLHAQQQEWDFKVYLDNRAIGEHSFRLDQQDGLKTLSSSAKFKVKLLFIEAYSYFHTAQERWRDDCLVSLEARTEENKDTTIVSGELDGSAFKVKAPKGDLALKQCVMTFAYWNPAMLKQDKLLNPQTGEWLDVRITPLGSEEIDVRDRKVRAERYRLEAPKMKIDLWYDSAKEWLRLQSITPEGYLITYKRK